MTPSAAVLRAMREQPERWSLCPHRADDSPDRKLADEILERLLPARWRCGLNLHDQPLPSDEFPLTAGFIRRVGERVLGLKISWARAYRVRREALRILYPSGYHPCEKRDTGFVLFKLRQDRFSSASPSGRSRRLPVRDGESELAATGAELLSTRERCQALLRDLFGERSPP